MSETAPSDDVTFVSRFNRVLAVVIWVLVAFVVVTTIVGTPGRGLLALVPGALIALADWVVLWRPDLVVGGDGVTMTNLARRVQVPWSALINVDTKFALTLYTPGHKYAAWAAPAPGRAGAAMAKRQARSGNVAPRAAVGGSARPGDLLSTDSGAAADMVLERWHELRENDGIELGQADTATVRSSWLWQPLAGIAVLAIATVLTIGQS